MGFFSDLKEDLSQAVNELMPEEQLDAVMSGSEEKKASGTGEAVDSLDLSSMLDKLEESEKTVEKATQEKDAKVQAAPQITVPEHKTPAAEPLQTVNKGIAPTQTINKSITPTQQPAPEEKKTIPVPEERKPVTEPVRKPDRKFGSFTTYQNNQRDGKKMETQEVMDETAIVTVGMTLTGDIVSKGSLELIGTVNGNIDLLGKLNITGTIQGNSKAAEIYAEGAKITGEINSQGSVKIGQSSVVIGNISATSAVIAGAVKGDIDVHGPVILDTSAIVMGNIKSKSVQINNGAVIEGMCSQCYADVNPTSFFEDFKKKKQAE